MGTFKPNELAWSWTHRSNQERRGVSVCLLEGFQLLTYTDRTNGFCCLPF